MKYRKFTTLMLSGLLALSASSISFASDADPENLSYNFNAETEVLEVYENDVLIDAEKLQGVEVPVEYFVGTFNNNPNTRLTVSSTSLKVDTYYKSLSSESLTTSDTVNVSGFWTSGTKINFGICKLNSSGTAYLLYKFGTTDTSGILASSDFKVSSATSADGSYYYYIASPSTNTSASNVGMIFTKK